MGIIDEFRFFIYQYGWTPILIPIGAFLIWQLGGEWIRKAMMWLITGFLLFVMFGVPIILFVILPIYERLRG